jgi:hypothetical protein
MEDNTINNTTTTRLTRTFGVGGGENDDGGSGCEDVQVRSVRWSQVKVGPKDSEHITLHIWFLLQDVERTVYEPVHPWS